MIVTSGLYTGRYRLRMGGGKLYIHIPAKLVEELGGRKVRVVAIINALACNDRILHGSLIAFTATLVAVGGTYRLTIPSRYASALRDVIDCVEIDVWVAPIFGRPALRGLGRAPGGRIAVGALTVCGEVMAGEREPP